MVSPAVEILDRVVQSDVHSVTDAMPLAGLELSLKTLANGLLRGRRVYEVQVTGRADVTFGALFEQERGEEEREGPVDAADSAGHRVACATRRVGDGYGTRS